MTTTNTTTNTTTTSSGIELSFAAGPEGTAGTYQGSAQAAQS